jgi:uncharacterized OB-fold protein
MPDPQSRDGVVYTETIVHLAPAQYTAEAPYQLAIVELDRGGRLTARVLGKAPEERAAIGERLTFVEERDGVAYYRRAANQ